MLLSIRFFFIVFVLSSKILSGQTDSSLNLNTSKVKQRHLLDFGIEGGVNYLDYIPNTPTQRIDIQQGISSGMHFQYNFGKHSSLVTAITYEQKKRKEVYSWNYRQETFDYITFPFLYKFSIGRRNLFFITTGPFASILIKKTEVNMYYTETFKSNRTELGSLVGVGARIPITKKFDITLEAKKYLNIIQTKPDFEYSQSNTFMAGINYKFGTIKNKVEKRDSILELYTEKKERKLFVKTFYSQQISSDSRTPSSKRFEDSYYGNSHTSYRYDGNSEVPQAGQEFGVLLEIKTRKHFNINTGFTYDLMQFQTKETTLFYSGWGDLLGSYSGSYKNTKIKYKFEFFSIPVILNFVHKAKKCSFYAGAGIEFKKLFSSQLSVENSYFKKIYAYHFGEPGYKTDPLNFFSVTNIGIDLPLSKNAAIFLEPNFKFELGNQHIPVNSTEVQMWSAGCKVGFKF